MSVLLQPLHVREKAVRLAVEAERAADAELARENRVRWDRLVRIARRAAVLDGTGDEALTLSTRGPCPGGCGVRVEAIESDRVGPCPFCWYCRQPLEGAA